jgi:hypothetical protein
MPGEFALDASRFPLVRLTPPANPTEEEIVAIYREYDTHLARGRHVLLVDMRRLNPLFGHARARQVTLREVEARMPTVERVMIAEAILVSGRIVRGIVTAFEWMRKKPRTFPLEIMEDEDEAIAWLTQQLEADGRSLPPRRPSRPIH